MNNKLLIGEKLKSIRLSKKLTLEELSKLTGVSKPMLGQIERGQSSPTINTLWKISNGLKTPFSVFLREDQAKYEIVSPEAGRTILEAEGLMRAFPLFPFDAVRSVESFYIELSPGCHRSSERHLDGAEEYIFVINGKMDLILDEKTITLHELQAIRFQADIPHSYANPYDAQCNIYDMVFY